jgi:hypothetical protein
VDIRGKSGEMTYVERLTELNLIPLVYDREKKDIILYFKCKNNFVDLDISQSVCRNYGKQNTCRHLLPFTNRIM